MVFSSSMRSPSAIQVQATGTSSEVQNASIAFVDRGPVGAPRRSSTRSNPPRFQFPEYIAASDVQTRWIVASTCSSSRSRRSSSVTSVRSQSFRAGEHRRDCHAAGRLGAGYIRSITTDRISSFSSAPSDGAKAGAARGASVVQTQTPSPSWFKSVVAIHQPDQQC